MWIEIFKTGKHVDSSGRAGEYTAEDLDGIAESYNTKILEDASFEAPVVKGHPATDAPAFGVVERLARRGNVLLAKLRDLSPDFVREVNDGAYKRVSVALYPDMFLRHVGFLGAATPAVKGLRAPNFRDGVSFAEFCSPEREISEYSDGKDSAPDSAERDCNDFSLENAEANEFADMKNFVPLSEYESLINENGDLKRALERMRRDAKETEYRTFAESLVNAPEGPCITPARAETLVKLLMLAYASSSKGEFSEGETIENEIIELFSNFDRTPRLKGEFAKSSGRADFSHDALFKPGRTNRSALHETALRIMNDDPGINYERALEIACE